LEKATWKTIGLVEWNKSGKGSKLAKCNNWEECNSLKKCNKSEKCINSKDKSLEEGKLEESNVGKGNIGNDNKLEEGTSKENNDGKFKDIGEWRSKPEEFVGPSPSNGNGIKLQPN